MKKALSLSEAGDMIASQPGPSLAEPNFIELISREIQKLRDSGQISPALHARAGQMLPGIRTSIINIYGRQVNGLQQAVAFLLRQAGRGM